MSLLAAWQSSFGSVDYLTSLKAHLSIDAEKRDEYAADCKSLASGKWHVALVFPLICTDLLELSSDQPLIHRLAIQLRNKPLLLYRLNHFIRPKYRLECTRSVTEVEFYVLVEGKKACIHATSSIDISLPSTDDHVRILLGNPDGWMATLRQGPPSQWMECLAQILQELLDGREIDADCRNQACRRLTSLAKNAIVPPSIFVDPDSFGVDPSQIMATAEYIASGGGCDVHRADVGDGSICLRLLRQTQASDAKAIRKMFCSEVVVWRQLKHPNVAPFMGASLDLSPKRLCFILPWFPFGSIVSFLKTNPTHDKCSAIVQIAAGVEYLHNLEPPVIHKDIKGANVLVDQNANCVLSDFGLSSILDSIATASKGLGTLDWMAPELFTHDEFDRDGRPRDIYSLGCTIYEILTGQQPFWIARAARRGVERSFPPDGKWSRREVGLWSIVKECVALDPLQRPMISRIVKVLLHQLPTELALVPATYGPQHAIPTATLRSAEPSVKSKKLRKGGLHQAFSRKEDQKAPEQPLAQYIPVFVPVDSKQTVGNPWNSQIHSTAQQAYIPPQPVKTLTPLEIGIPQDQPMAPIPPVPSSPPVIRFDQRGKYAVFMNHSPHRIIWQNKVYPTALHLHEALRFLDTRPDLAESIRLCKKPEDVYSLSQPFHQHQRPDWGQFFLDLMREILYQKFRQHPDLRTKLIMTGAARLIYVDHDDTYWGSGDDMTGQNQFGQALVDVRQRLLDEVPTVMRRAE